MFIWTLPRRSWILIFHFRVHDRYFSLRKKRRLLITLRYAQMRINRVSCILLSLQQTAQTHARYDFIGIIKNLKICLTIGTEPTDCGDRTFTVYTYTTIDIYGSPYSYISRSTGYAIPSVRDLTLMAESRSIDPIGTNSRNSKFPLSNDYRSHDSDTDTAAECIYLQKPADYIARMCSRHVVCIALLSRGGWWNALAEPVEICDGTRYWRN